jgi:hypothetical protein
MPNIGIVPIRLAPTHKMHRYTRTVATSLRSRSVNAVHRENAPAHERPQEAPQTRNAGCYQTGTKHGFDRYDCRHQSNAVACNDEAEAEDEDDNAFAGRFDSIARDEPCGQGEEKDLGDYVECRYCFPAGHLRREEEH